MWFQEEVDQSNNKNKVNSRKINDLSKALALKYSVLVAEPSCTDSPDSREYEMSKLTSKSSYSGLHPIMTKTQVCDYELTTNKFTRNIFPLEKYLILFH